MSVKSKAQLEAEINAEIIENTQELITATQVNNILIDIVDSSFNLIDNSLTGGTGGNNIWTAGTGYFSIIANNGSSNQANGSFAIAAGYSNNANGASSNVGGGTFNLAYDLYSSVGGGLRNSATTFLKPPPRS